jgi:hypothetical protein
LNPVRKVAYIMGNTPKNDGVVVLGGREFKRVKDGLDEAQVASFIDELIKERDELAQSNDHIASLNRLAEMTVVEADKLATQLKTEAEEQAKAESTAIIDKAKEQARQMSEKKIAEAVEIANEEANAIKAKAEEEAALLLENERNKIRGELRDLVNQQFGSMLEGLESLKQQAAAVQTDFDSKLSKPKEKDSAAAARITEGSKAPDEQPEPSQATYHTEKSFELSRLFESEDKAKLGKPQWEVEISPPFDIAKIMEVVSFLDQLPEVANTEMIVPQIDTPSILVFLHDSMNLVDVLQTIPAVAHVEEVTTDKSATSSKPGEEPRKVRISLVENTTSQEKNKEHE